MDPEEAGLALILHNALTRHSAHIFESGGWRHMADIDQEASCTTSADCCSQQSSTQGQNPVLSRRDCSSPQEVSALKQGSPHETLSNSVPRVPLGLMWNQQELWRSHWCGLGRRGGMDKEAFQTWRPKGACLAEEINNKEQTKPYQMCWKLHEMNNIWDL